MPAITKAAERGNFIRCIRGGGCRWATISITASGLRAPGKHMLFVLLGVLLIILNLANIGPFGAWNWEFFGDLWKFTVPFILAAAWWIWSDVSGLNKRREMERMEQRKKDRRKERSEEHTSELQSLRHL